MPDRTPPTDQQLDELAALIARTTPVGAVTASPGLLDMLVAEVRRQRAGLAVIEGLERAFTTELNDDRALALLDALIVLRSKLRCTCARSQGLHEKSCLRYVPGHELLSPARRLARAREELRPAAVAAGVTGEGAA